MAIKVPTEEQGPCRRCCICLIFLAFVLGLTASFVLVCIFASMKPHYYTAIEAVSGLDAATDLGKPALDHVEFHLIIGVKSRNPFSSMCLEHGVSVMVTYIDTQIASSITGSQACAAGWKPEQMVRMPVVARGTRVRLPDSMLVSLMVDQGRGAALFDVSLLIPSTTGDNGKLVVCRGMRAGGVVQALSTPCEENKSS